MWNFLFMTKATLQSNGKRKYFKLIIWVNRISIKEEMNLDLNFTIIQKLFQDGL